MPLCEGRPYEPCPRKAQGSLSQRDLILCQECEEFRFPSIKAARLNKGKDKIAQPRQSTANLRSLHSNDRDTTATKRDDNPDVEDSVFPATSNIMSAASTDKHCPVPSFNTGSANSVNNVRTDTPRHRLLISLT